MIPPEKFVSILKKKGFNYFTGVPCSFFQSAMNCVLGDKTLSYTMVPNEGSALALAAGAVMAGKPTVVMIQNSGFGNLINPLTSLNMIYRIPALIFMSGRAYGVPDEPQHEIIGKTMNKMLDAMGIKYQDLPEKEADFDSALSSAKNYMETEKLPFVFLVRQGTVGSYETNKPVKKKYSLKRIEAIEILTKALKGDEYVIATTGKPSRELFSVNDRKENFYMQGSMGHAASIGLGVALAHPKRKVVILDGDGAVLMHMGILSSIGHYKPKNLFHIVLDNEAYETTGDQDTTSPTTDFVKIAKACGYRSVAEASNEKDLKVKLKVLLKQNGPVLIRVKINRLPTDKIPRISNKYTSVQIAENFKNALS